MKKLLIILSILILASCSGKNKDSNTFVVEEDTITDDPPIQPPLFSDGCNGERKPVETGRTNYIIVKNTYFYPIDILKANAVLLITDKEDIIDNERLFFNNEKPYEHTCGYHYNVNFWKDAYTIVKYQPFNIECDAFCFDHRKIHRKMRKYAKLLAENPTHYFYNVDIDINHSPKTVSEVLKDSSMLVFYPMSKYNSDLKQNKKSYNAELIAKSSDLEEVKTQLAKYGFIKNVAEEESLYDADGRIKEE